MRSEQEIRERLRWIEAVRATAKTDTYWTLQDTRADVLRWVLNEPASEPAK